MPDNILSPKRIAAEAFTDAAAAVARLAEIYERNVSFLRTAFEAYVRGEPLDRRVRAAYPFGRITTGTHARLDSRLSYGFVSGPGVYETSVTRPDLFRGYFTEQIGLLMQNHGVPVEIGESDEPIPIHFAYRRDINIAASVPARDRPLRDLFDTPDLASHRRRDRQRHAACRPARAAARHVPGCSRRLFAAPALPLYRHGSGALPELRDLHQLPILRRRLRAHLPRAHGERGSGGDAFVEPGNIITPKARLRRPGPSTRRRSACRRCRLFIWFNRVPAASP